MFINSINKVNTNAVKSQNVSYKGINPVVERNKIKILLSPYVLGEKVSVVKPKTMLEKEVLLEVLKHRLNLDILTKLSSDRFKTGQIIDEYNDLVDKDPKSERCLELKKEISKKGNIKNYYKMNKRLIEAEKKRQQASVEFFNEIFGSVKVKDGSVCDDIYVQEQGLEDEYISKGLISKGQISKFYEQMKKNNINKNGDYNVRELINIIENDTIEVQELKTNNLKMTTAQLMKQVENTYENYLKEVVDIYSYEEEYWKKAQQGKKFVEEKFKNQLKHDNSLGKKFAKIYKDVEERFTKNAYRLENVRYNDVGAFWNYLKELEDEMIICDKELKDLKIKLDSDRKDMEVKKEILKKVERLHEIREVWLEHMIQSIHLENENYKIMDEVGIAKEYSYLVERNKDLNRYSSIFKVYKENNDRIPEEFWSEILNSR